MFVFLISGSIEILDVFGVSLILDSFVASGGTPPSYSDFRVSLLYRNIWVGS